MIHRSCVCNRELHNYTISPENHDRRLSERACCRCPEDCLCHGSEAFTTRKEAIAPPRRLKDHLQSNMGVSGEGDS